MMFAPHPFFMSIIIVTFVHMIHNEELSRALEIIESTHTHLFLTGKAGTGKTTFLRRLQETLPKRMVVVAPTGIAAINAGGVTIHSFFQLPLSPYIPDGNHLAQSGFYRVSNEKQRLIRSIDLLVIDEISMVRADLLDSVDYVLRKYRDRTQPFGGVQLLFIGDLYQLPPVVVEEEWKLLSRYYDSPYFFSSKSLQQTTMLTIELQQVYRQKDVNFLNLLEKIRTNQADETVLNTLNGRYIPDFIPPADTDYIYLTTHNHIANSINEEKLAALPGKNYTFSAEVSGNFPTLAQPTDDQLHLKVGAQVMFVKNDSTGQGRYYNGMIGEVTAIDSHCVWVKSKQDDTMIETLRETWNNTKYTLNDETGEIKEEIEGSFKQYPLRTAWAITIHKSQGLTFDHAIIDAQQAFSHGQTYVALSRCRTLEGMVLNTPLRVDSVICDTKISAFHQQAHKTFPSDKALQEMKLRYVIALLDELFSILPLAQTIYHLTRLIQEHLSRKYPKTLAQLQTHTATLNNLLIVREKFARQYKPLVQQQDKLSQALLQERIHAGATYYKQCLEPIKQFSDILVVDTDNKTLKPRLKQRVVDVKDRINYFYRLYSYWEDCSNEFTVATFLREKGRLLGLSTSATQVRTKKKQTSKTSKEPQKPTKEISYELFLSGKTIEQISLERSLAPNTVVNHLCNYVAAGKLQVRDFVSDAHYQAIKTFVETHPEQADKLSNIKQNVSEGITYQDIRFVLASLSSNNKL